MIDERDIWRAAKALLDRHGAENASREATQRMDQLLAEGDEEGAAVWRLILAAIADLAKEAPEDGESVH